MKSFETILLPVDFGPGMAPAMDTAAALANVLQSQLVLIHVMPESQLSSVSRQSYHEEVEERLQQAGQKLESRGAASPLLAVRYGKRAETICREAIQCDADVILFGCGPKSHDREYGAGITVERVLRRTATPVWVAKAGNTALPRSILCPTDTSAASLRALRFAIHLCRTFGSSLTVLNVHESYIAEQAAQLSQEDADARRARRLCAFDTLLSGVDFSDVDWTKRLRHGSPHRVIAGEAVQQDADLIIMGAVGKAGSGVTLLGGVTRKLLLLPPCSILLIKEKDALHVRLDSIIASLEDDLDRGHQLLANRRPAEASRQFDHCLMSDPTCALAWDGKAIALERLGKDEQALAARSAAEKIRDRLWQLRIVA
jgi:nucleotide-binding universal stress UspA family protein